MFVTKNNSLINIKLNYLKHIYCLLRDSENSWDYKMKSYNKYFSVGAMLALMISPVMASDRHHESFAFALIGDTPYGVAPYTVSDKFDRMQAEINKDRSLRWVLHAGDIKSGSSECSDDLFYDRLDRYNDFKKPFVMTLGDNEWTDCHRVKAGEYQPLERLSKLREVFFENVGKSLGKKKMRVSSQASVAGFEEFPENVMWSKNNVVFSAVHVVGSKNGLLDFDPASSAVRTVEDDLEVERRTQSAISWINTTFDKAESNNASGVFIMIHANPVLEFKWLLTRNENGIVERTGFDAILHTLQLRTAAFGRPVVLAHGDSHWFRVDKPELPSADTAKDVFLSNFTRVETFGASQVNWVKVNVNPDADEVFQFQQMMVEGNN